jgi:hypothetical protein
MKRAARIGMEREAAERERDVDNSSVLSLPTSSTDQQHLVDQLKRQLSALRQLLNEKTAEIDNLHQLNAQLRQASSGQAAGIESGQTHDNWSITFASFWNIPEELATRSSPRAPLRPEHQGLLAVIAGDLSTYTRTH